MPQDAVVRSWCEIQSDSEHLVKWRVTWRAGYWTRRYKIALFGDLIDSKTESRREMYKVPRRTDRRMFTSLRMMKLMRDGKSARCEAELMVREKIDAALEATASLMAGASGDKIVHRYRKRVAANAKRLSRPNSGRTQKRKPRRK
jgi:hypothetical protein